MSREMFRDFLYLRLYLYYREDLDIYLDINEVKDNYNNDIIKTATSTVDRPSTSRSRAILRDL